MGVKTEWFKLEGEAVFDDLIDSYKDDGIRAINDVLHGEGAALIQRNIENILPVSGRKWNKKKKAASAAKPFEHRDSLLAVTIVSKSYYHYLYFPDDGENTKRHAGGKHFMMRGAEESEDRIIEMCLGKLLGN